ncbi:MAG: diaminopimelate epimerase [Lachnospiraceae bacterium]|nr:diaminopimelate epimerase [Lachnospiraceae bacterium]
MKFIKMHGIGNDYIFVNCFEEQVREPEKLAIALSNRHFGVGGDGLILIKPTGSHADAKMEIYNADGSRAQMCGNGIRCVAWYVFYYKKLERDNVYIEADDSTVKSIYLKRNGYNVETITVNMGRPRLKSIEVPIIISGKEAVIGEIVKFRDAEFKITCVNMGNPHCVIFVNDFESDSPEKYGSLIENSIEIFPERVNAEFVRVVTRKYCRMRVWERGSGVTLACGTGACAVVVAGVLNGLLDREVTVELDGGILTIKWDEETGEVLMTGDVKKVFVGEI